jgi:hypothetical protein
VTASSLQVRWQSALLVAAWFGTIGALAVAAQPRQAPRPAGPTPRAGSWEISGGVDFGGGYDFGSSDADLTRNTASGADTFTLFTADSQVNSATALFGRLGYYFSPRLAVEGGLRFGRPVFKVDLSGDTEQAPNVTAEETLNRYVFEASVLWHFSRPAARPSRVLPFVFGGAGYLRELHESQELVETGVEYHAGGGLKIWFGSAPRRLGFRGEGGVSIRDGGFDFEEGVRLVPMAAGSLVYIF